MSDDPTVIECSFCKTSVELIKFHIECIERELRDLDAHSGDR